MDNEKKYGSMDWRERINAVLRADKLVDSEFLEAMSHDAGGWVTCACGKLDPRIERDQSDGAPLDTELVRLGLLFHKHINNMQYFFSRTNDTRLSSSKHLNNAVIIEQGRFALETISLLDVRESEVLAAPVVKYYRK